MTINESIDTQAEIIRLHRMIVKIGNSDPLKLKYLEAELKYYEGMKGSTLDCIKNAKASEIAKLRCERARWKKSLCSEDHNERAFAADKIESINSAISLIQSFL